MNSPAKLILIFVLATVLSVIAPLASAEPEQLVKYRESFEKRLRETLRPATEKYLADLADLERQRVLDEDYEGALAARQRRDGLELPKEGTSEAPEQPPAVGGDPPGTIVIALRGGSTSGSGISFDADAGAYRGFKRKGSSVTWSIPKIDDGTYRVLVAYGCAKRPFVSSFSTSRPKSYGGEFTIREGSSLLTADSTVLKHTVQITGGWDKVVTRDIGALRVAGGRLTLRLTAEAPRPDGMMSLHGLKLVPTTAGASATLGTPRDPSVPERLQNLRDTFREQLGERTAVVIAAHIAALKSREEALIKADRLGEAVRFREERLKVEKLLDDPRPLVQIENAPSE